MASGLEIDFTGSCSAILNVVLCHYEKISVKCHRTVFELSISPENWGTVALIENNQKLHIES